LYIPVQKNQQMLKGVVSFIILIKLPHVSAANCHLQGVTCFLQATPVLSVPRVVVGYGSLGVASRHGIAMESTASDHTKQCELGLKVEAVIHPFSIL
jgi:hypothetical protein